MRGPAHSRDHGRDCGVAQTEAKCLARQLVQCHTGIVEQFLKVIPDLLLAFATKILVAGLTDFVDQGLPFLLVRPFVVPHMELIKIDRIAAQVFQGFLEASQNVLSGEDVGEFGARLRGPNAVLGRHLSANVSQIALS